VDHEVVAIDYEQSLPIRRGSKPNSKGRDSGGRQAAVVAR
jgi:hypothetical protein